ncbi:hypothetical protein GUJ93_ZPchr0013g36605 [Zizania palustris]|uniref:N-acetyl-gamma-glutamyl-phosphate reductase dimerisation domain-containing protein n=1 Tax=Zizania palustris TaxID=103762 RepID=A0A8J5WYC2_ZIZPA|nr:hypothetical protein GUJ93_ZPchr0013g36605 [Zizania palustris]
MGSTALGSEAPARVGLAPKVTTVLLCNYWIRDLVPACRVDSVFVIVPFLWVPFTTPVMIVRLLANHPQFRIKVMTADRKAGQQFASVFPHLITQEIIKGLPQQLNIVDLSTNEEYAEWYGHSHMARELQLPLVPLIKAKLIKVRNIIIDAKSGVSGPAEGIHAYGIKGHRHVPEIEQGLSDAAESKVTIRFTPNLICMKRGMQSTMFVVMAPGVTVNDLYQHLKSTYEGEEFAKLIPGWAIIISVTDNLVKGASGQAVQNLNLMMGLPESTGLQYQPLFP